MASLADAATSCFLSIGRASAWGPVGSVPSELDFSVEMRRVFSDMDLAVACPVRSGESGRSYLAGFADCHCRRLSSLGWDRPLVWSVVATVLALVYLDRYLVYETGSWRDTLMGVLGRYFTGDFAGRFLDGALGMINIGGTGWV